jgi:hypothetical protein
MTDTDWRSVEALLRRWELRARDSQRYHYIAANRMLRYRAFFGIPAVALSLFVGTSVFYSLEHESSLKIKLVVGFASVAAAVLSGLQGWLAFEQRAEEHRQAGARYASVRRRIEQVCALPVSARGEITEVVELIRGTMDSLAQDSPALPPKLWDSGPVESPTSALVLELPDERKVAELEKAK